MCRQIVLSLLRHVDVSAKQAISCQSEGGGGRSGGPTPETSGEMLCVYSDIFKHNFRLSF